MRHRPKGGSYWLCHCDCGNDVSVSGHFLMTGHVRDCGCEGNKGNKANEGKSFFAKHDCGSCLEKKDCDKEFCKYEKEFERRKANNGNIF